MKYFIMSGAFMNSKYLCEKVMKKKFEKNEKIFTK